jgi:hypothetical protein
MDTTQKCPYCAEEIRAEAVRCRYCRSWLAGSSAEGWREGWQLSGWHRDHADARLAGVRLGFILLTFVHLLGAFAYAALWLVIPAREGEDPVLEILLREGRSFCRRVRCERRSPGPTSGDPASGGGSAGS